MYFKDTQNKPYFEPSASVIDKLNLVEITKEQFDTIVAEINTPTPEQLNQQRISEIKSELQRLDLESVRPLRAINAGTDTAEDRDKLAELDSQAEALRQELATLEGQQ